MATVGRGRPTRGTGSGRRIDPCQRSLVTTGRSIDGDGREMAARMRGSRGQRAVTQDCRTREGRRRECAARRKSCNARNNTPCNIYKTTNAQNVQHATCTVQHATVQEARCNMPHAHVVDRPVFALQHARRQVDDVLALERPPPARHLIPAYACVCGSCGTYAVVPQGSRLRVCAACASTRACARRHVRV